MVWSHEESHTLTEASLRMSNSGAPYVYIEVQVSITVATPNRGVHPTPSSDPFIGLGLTPIEMARDFGRIRREMD